MKQTTKHWLRVAGTWMSIAVAVAFGLYGILHAADVEKAVAKQTLSDTEHKALGDKIDAEKMARETADKSVMTATDKLSNKVDSVKSDTDQIKGAVETILAMLKTRLVEAGQ